MRGAVIYGAGDVRFEDLPEPEIVAPTDAIIRTTATCVCGSDLWDYRGINPVPEPKPFGHEYCGVVEEVGSDVTSVKPGQFVIGSFYASDGTCPNCRNGVQSSCVHRRVDGRLPSGGDTDPDGRRQSGRTPRPTRRAKRFPTC